MDMNIIIKCENMTEKDIDELYHQIALKISPYGAIMWRDNVKQLSH